MKKLGIIGAENSHSAAVARTCNELKAVPMRVPMIWGETRAFAEKAAERGSIPTIVKDWREMLGQVDGVMIDHRHPQPHYEVAKFFIEAGVPTFVDKPLTHTLRDGIKLMDLAEKTKTPVITFSSIPMATSYQQFKKDLKKMGRIHAFASTGPASTRSKYGGIFFYGIHQVDAIIEIMGTDVKSAYLQENKPNGLGIIAYKDGSIATMECIDSGVRAFQWRAVTDKGVVNQSHVGDENPYLGTVKAIHNMIAKGKMPWDRKRMLTPVAVLEAMQKSLKTKKPVNISNFA